MKKSAKKRRDFMQKTSRATELTPRSSSALASLKKTLSTA